MTEACPKILVVFFSRTGCTKHLAEAIASAEQGEIEELREARPRRGWLGWLRSGYEGSYRRSAVTLPLEHDLTQYDLIFVGSPTWSRSLSSPVRGFLEQHRAQLKDVAVFATCAGRGADDVLEQMAALLQSEPLARLPMLERAARNTAAVRAGEFAEAAITAWRARHAAAAEAGAPPLHTP